MDRVSEQERRMQVRKLRRRIIGACNLLFDATRGTVAKKLPKDQVAALLYLRYLCGLEPDAGDLNPHKKACVGNIFEETHKKHRNQLKNLPQDIMPGMTAVYANRKIVSELQSKSGKAKRDRGQSGENMVHDGESHAQKIIRQQSITW